MRIRLSGTPKEIGAVLTAMAEVLEFREVSEFYPNRGVTKVGRVYVDVEIPDIPESRLVALPPRRG
jgi:hypothetical protein